MKVGNSDFVVSTINQTKTMTKQLKPSNRATPTNSKLVGVSVDRNGNLIKVRVQFKLLPKDNVPVFSEPISINPIELVWERRAATL